MDRRALTLLAAAGLVLATPAWAGAASAESLLARGDTGTLTADGIAAGGETGTLTQDATPAGSGSSSSSSSSSSSTAAAADQLPFTGSDPRITLLLGVAAVLAGAGMRMRTGDARDY